MGALIDVPGCGKSALLASLVCAAHKKIIEAAPDIRDYLRAQHPEGVPSPNDALVAIHARGRGLEEIAAAVAEQLGLAVRDEAVTPAELIAHIQRMETPPPLVFDALDEADNPGELVDRLLLPLAKGACRLLVEVPGYQSALSARPWPTRSPRRSPTTFQVGGACRTRPEGTARRA